MASVGEFGQRVGGQLIDVGQRFECRDPHVFNPAMRGLSGHGGVQAWLAFQSNVICAAASRLGCSCSCAGSKLP